MEGIHDGKCLTPYSYIQIFTIKELISLQSIASHNKTYKIPTRLKQWLSWGLIPW